jgi:hypothetical protein
MEWLFMGYCSQCEDKLTGHEVEICMDCANHIMVTDKEYTRKKIKDFKSMGYSDDEIQEAIKGDKYIKLDEVE